MDIPKPCHLCEKTAVLRKSHVLPAFLFRWLRTSSATGHLRFAENINRRIQDGWKLESYCNDSDMKEKPRVNRTRRSSIPLHRHRVGT